MAETKATPRKKPVRKAPVQKDYPTKLDWLRAMTEYETKQAEATTAAKVARLEKRLASKQTQLDKLQREVNRLIDEIGWLQLDEIELAGVPEDDLADRPGATSEPVG